MPESTFKEYCRSLWKAHLHRAVPWARDNLVVGFFLLITPLIAALLVYGVAIDWKVARTTIVMYVVVFVVYWTFHFFRAAWKLDVNRLEKIASKDIEFSKMVTEKDEEFHAVVRMKDGEKASELYVRDAEIERLKRAIGGTEWRELADRFKALSVHMRVSCQQIGGSDDNCIYRWMIVGQTQAESSECIALCSLAGAMLKKSPKVSLSLSDNVRRQAEDSDRWLLFLKESGAMGDITYFSEQLDDGNRLPHFLGDIKSFGQVSSRFCIQCAATEI